MLAAPSIPLPRLTRIVACPTFGAEGALHETPGYSTETKTYYAPFEGFSVPPVAFRPSKQDVEKANNLILDDLLGDFPFSGDAENAHAVSLLLLPFARDLIAGPTPLHLIEAPEVGTGKSLLADSLMFPAAGVTVPGSTEAGTEDEWRKRITANLMTAPAFFFIDNLRRGLDSAALASATTATRYSDRILGRSEQVDLPVRCVWVITGNNPTLSQQMARRAVRIRLDATAEQPWLRKDFRHPDLRKWVRSERSALVWAALVLIQAWIAEGRPDGDKVLGSYEDWAQVMGGILDVHGIKGFLDNAQDLYAASNTEAAGYQQCVEAWWSRFHERPVGVADLFLIVLDMETIDLGDGTVKSQKTRLGTLLLKLRGRQFGPYRIEEAGKSTTGANKGARTYRLRDMRRPVPTVSKGNMENLGNLADPKRLFDGFNGEPEKGPPDSAGSPCEPMAVRAAAPAEVR